jgi:hypothetical protein
MRKIKSSTDDICLVTGGGYMKRLNTQTIRKEWGVTNAVDDIEKYRMNWRLHVERLDNA